MSICIHRLTRAHYSEAVRLALGKGGLHASLIYSEYYQTGQVVGDHPAFNNCRPLLQQIVEATDFSLPPISTELNAGETNKFLLTFKDGLESESVVIPMKAGPTLCVSSQVGCGRGCAFCETGKMGLLRSLTAEEIIAQLAHARRQHLIRSVVFMGMGEPMDNLDEVLVAIEVMTDQGGLAIGASRISVSTSGHVDGILRLSREAPPSLNLAVSVNAPNDEVRNRIMPINRRWNMGALRAAMETYCAHPRRTILAEYVLLEGITDSLDAADQLADYLQGLRVKINLIPYNPQRKDRFAPPTLEVMEAFAKSLRSAGYQTMLRLPKGQPIMAACGQLGRKQLRAK